VSADSRRFLAESFRQSLRLVVTGTERLLLVLPPVLRLLWPLAALLLVRLVQLMLPLVHLVGLQLVHLLTLLHQLAEAKVSHQTRAHLLAWPLLYDLLHLILYQAHPSTATPVDFTAVSCQKKPPRKRMTPSALLLPHPPTLRLSILRA